MRKVITSLLAVLSLVCLLLINPVKVQAQCYVNIPNAAFKSYLLGNASINTNSNSEIECAEATAFTGSISVQALGINNLTGIEAFINLTALTCYNNSLTTLNVSANTHLTYLSCFQNQLTTLNLNNNTQLQSLLFSYNQIPTINLSANTALTFVVCDNGQLTNLDLSANTAVTYINCYNNPLLTNLNIQNGNNSNLTYFGATICPQLSCIKVDNAGYMNANWSAGKDAGATFSTICPLPCFVNIPNANFKAALLANAAINTNSNSEIECSEAAAYAGAINVSNLNITDVTGLGAFVNITSFNCSHNQISGLSVTNNTHLTFLDVSFNSLSGINVSSNTSLTNLYVQNNTINTINLAGLSSLVQFNCDNNSLSALDVSGNTALQYLSCGTNSITGLNTSALTSLVQLYREFATRQFSVEAMLLGIEREVELAIG